MTKILLFRVATKSTPHRRLKPRLNGLYRYAFLALLAALCSPVVSAQTVAFNTLLDTTVNNTPKWLWAKRMGGAAMDRASSVAVDAAGNLYAVGTFNGTARFGNVTLAAKGAEDVFIVKYDSLGHVRWARSAGGSLTDRALEVTTDAAGNVYVAGTFGERASFGQQTLTSKGATDIFVVKYNAAGQVLWAKAAGGAQADNLHRFATDAAGNVYLAGAFSGTVQLGTVKITAHGLSAIFIARFNAAGHVQWAKNAGGTGGNAVQVRFDATGNAYAAGNYAETITLGAITLKNHGPQNVFIARYTAAGHVKWARSAYAHANNDVYSYRLTARSLAIDAAGSVYISGLVQGSAQFGETALMLQDPYANIGAYLAKYDHAGQLMQVKVVAETEYSLDIVGLATTNTNQVVMAYNIQSSFSTGTNAQLAAYDAAGNAAWSKTYAADFSEEFGDNLTVHSIAATASGFIYITGSFNGSANIGSFPLSSTQTSTEFTAVHDPVGKVIWAQMVTATDLVTDAAKNLYVLGLFADTTAFGPVTLRSAGATDGFFAKLTLTASRGFYTGASPHHLTIADLNADGNLDLITANYTHAVSILLSAGAGRFRSSPVFSAVTTPGYYPFQVMAEDVNRDGKIDLISANINNTVAVALGQGAGQFKEPVAFGVGSYPSSLTSADFNQDGNLDVATADYFDYGVSVLLGDGRGAFAAARTFSVDSDPRSIAAGDVNSDGQPDLITANGDNTVTVLLGNGAGEFAAPRLFAVGLGADNVLLRDFNGDGWLDIMTANTNGDDLSLLTGDGAGTFADARSVVVGPNPASFTAADVNNDHYPDLITTNYNRNEITVLLGAGAGLFAAATRFPVGDHPTDIAAADLNADGKPDVMTANTGDNTISVLVNATVPASVAASSWNKRFGGDGIDRFTRVIATADGGYLLGGHSQSGVSGDRTAASRGSYDFWIVKTDAAGRKLWDRRYGGPAQDYLNALIPTADGGYLLGGSSRSGSGSDKTEGSRGSQDYWVVKITNTGVKQWDKRYGGAGFDDLRQVAQLASGDYMLAGSSDSPAGGDKTEATRGGSDYWVLKISNAGVKLWDKRFGGPLTDRLEGLVPTTDGGLLLGGSSASEKSGDQTRAGRGGSDYWLVKLNAAGVKLWDQRYGGPADEQLYALVAAADSGFVLAGTSASGLGQDKSQLSQGLSDYWLLKVNRNGVRQWDKGFGGRREEVLRDLIPTTDGGYLLGGYSSSGVSGDKTVPSKGSFDYWAVKTDGTGAKLWDKRFGGAAGEELRSVLQTTDGGYLLGGRSNSGATGDRTQPSQGNTDYWLVKIGADGGPAAANSWSSSLVRSAAAGPELAPIATDWLTAYPNPFYGQVTIQFSVAQTQAVNVKLYDNQGREVNTWYQVEAQAGRPYQLTWQPGPRHAAGLYLLKVYSATKTSYHKIILTR